MTPAPQPPDRRALAALALCTLIPALGTSVANVSLPTLAATFDAPFRSVQWVVLAYLLTLTSAIVGVGRVGDARGRRRVLAAGIALHTAASALGGLATGLPAAIAARAAQGLGAAAMMALALALVGQVTPKERLGRAMGLMGAMSAVGTALGPSLGGALLAWAGWRSIFFVQVPLGLAALRLVLRHVPADPPGSRRSGSDPLGTLLLAATLTAYALAVTADGGVEPRLLAAAGAGALLFAAAEARAASPLIRPATLRDPALVAGLAASALVATVVMTTMVVGPFHLSRALGLAPAAVGLVMSAGPLVAALTSAPAGRLVDRVGARRATVAGLLAMALGATALTAAPLGIAGFVLPIVTLTAGYALFQTANNTGVMRGVADADRGVVSAMLNLSRNLGLVTGASVMGAVFAAASGAEEITTALPEQVAAGTRGAFAVAALLVTAALLASAARRPRALAVAALALLAARPALAASAGVWGGESLSLDLRAPGERVGALVSVDLAERATGPAWQAAARPGIGVIGSIGRTDLSASAGYGLVAGPAADGAWQVEHRAWQQVQVDARLAPEAPARLTGRLRLEQRDLPGGWDLRLRLLARGLLPVGRGGWGVSLWDEAFVTLDAPTAGFDQNRAFVGPYHQSAAGVRVEVGYLNLLRRDGTSGLTDSHVASLQVSVGLRPRR